MGCSGIYAVEGVMNVAEWAEQYGGPVLEMLCAFVRECTIGKTVSKKPAIDIQAALTVIGRRKGQELPDLAEDNIPDANPRGPHLRGVTLSRPDLNTPDPSARNRNRATLASACPRAPHDDVA